MKKPHRVLAGALFLSASMGHAAGVYGVIEGVYQTGYEVQESWSRGYFVNSASPGKFRYEFSYDTIRGLSHGYGSIRTTLYSPGCYQCNWRTPLEGSTQVYSSDISLYETPTGQIQLEISPFDAAGALSLNLPGNAFTDFSAGPYLDWYVPTGQNVQGKHMSGYAVDYMYMYLSTYTTVYEYWRKFDLTHISIKHTDQYSPVPIPGAAILFGSALAGLGLQAKRRKA